MRQSIMILVECLAPTPYSLAFHKGRTHHVVSEVNTVSDAPQIGRDTTL